MLDKIRAFFSNGTAESGDSEAVLHLAAAVLLFEIAKSDQSIDEAEIVRLRATLKREWQLDDTDVGSLLDYVRESPDTGESLNQQVDLINRNFAPERKLNLVRGLWQVACADGQIHRLEEQLIIRLAGLLQVSEAEWVRCRDWALGLQTDDGE
jgi:uncharacterized tellurite resistance protein B-like protein